MPGPPRRPGAKPGQAGPARRATRGEGGVGALPPHRTGAEARSRRGCSAGRRCAGRDLRAKAPAPRRRPFSFPNTAVVAPSRNRAFTRSRMAVLHRALGVLALASLAVLATALPVAAAEPKMPGGPAEK